MTDEGEHRVEKEEEESRVEREEEESRKRGRGRTEG